MPRQTKTPPNCLRALGRHDMPPHILIRGERFDRVRVFKHDFFAATGLYRSRNAAAIVKMGRRTSLLGIPLAWTGRLLSRQETCHLRRVADLPGVPRLLPAPDQNTVVREFIAGQHLRKGAMVGDLFFDRLTELVDALHARGMAYVDLEKPENVLVGEDGRPYLIDFQISWPWPLGWINRLPGHRWLLARFQEGDRYHLRKLQRRIRPDQLTPEQLEASYQKPVWVRAHRMLTVPFTKLRRWILARVDPRRASGERGRLLS